MRRRGRGLAVGVGAIALLLTASWCGPIGPETIISGCVGGIDPEDWVGRAPLSLCMSGRMSSGDTVLDYSWDFGDGTFGTGENVTHTYTAIGDYRVTLTCTYAGGDVIDQWTTVSVAGEPEASFIATPYQPFNFGVYFGFIKQDPEPTLEMRFDARDSYPEESTSSKYVPVLLSWRFGDGTTETVVVDNQSYWNPFGNNTEFRTRHTYPAPGVYEVSLTITDSLGYSDTTTQRIAVGIPTPGDDEDVSEQFTLTSSFWDVEDEGGEEDGCLSIYGVVTNGGPLAAGVELTATAYAGAVAVGSISHWAAGVYNIEAGVDYAYGLFLCDLSVPAEQVTSVEVVISDAVVY